MSDPFDSKSIVEQMRLGAPACDPTKRFCAAGRQGGGWDDPANDKPEPTKLPPINFAERGWRDHCLRGKAVIPAGYTYFGQLIGHDLGRSLPLDQVPHVSAGRAIQQNANDDYGATRYNVIENPLTLETVYGPGPQVLPHLYDHQTRLFRISPRNVITVALVQDDAGIRALYDNRNRDTHILHRMTACMMKFHNLVAGHIMRVLGFTPQMSSDQAMQVYALARAHVLRVWHGLIVKDWLPTFVDPDVRALTVVDIENVPVLDETSLLHGLFRSFHALPRRSYRFPVVRRLDELLLDSPLDKEHGLTGWPLDWGLFFDRARDGTRTGLCASFAPDFAPSGGIGIAELDTQTAQITNALTLNSHSIREIARMMKAPLRRQLTPEALAAAFTEHCASAMGQALTAQDIRDSPLFLILLLEAQVYGGAGRFGPLGSILLYRAITEAVSKVQPGPPARDDWHLPQPATMLDLLTLTTMT